MRPLTFAPRRRAFGARLSAGYEPPLWLLFAVSMAAALACLPLPAQQPSEETATPEVPPVPRTADGKPDLSGIFLADSMLPFLEGEEAIAAAREWDRLTGREPTPRAEPPPYNEEAEERRQYYLSRRGIDDPMAQCLLTGVPRINFRPLPFEIVQLPDRVILLYEIHHAFRIIPIDAEHPDDLEPSYLGDSVGYWDGDTLVVDVVGFNEKTWLSGVGTIHSDQLRVTERFTRDTYHTIRYEARMEDPVVFTEPWTLYATFRLRPNERLREYECIENNEDLLRIERLLESGEFLRDAE